MTTPFASFQNAVITFKIPSGSPTVDEYGNTKDTLIDWSVIAFLKQKKKSTPTAQDIALGNIEGIRIEGKCVEPRFLHSSILPQQLGICVLNGISYQFKYEPSIPSPFYPENEILGQRISGIITQTTLDNSS